MLKHHCVADMNVTVYDGMELVERSDCSARAAGSAGVLTDGRSRWEITADAFVDAADLPAQLPAAIPAAAEAAAAVLASLR